MFEHEGGRYRISLGTFKETIAYPAELYLAGYAIVFLTKAYLLGYAIVSFALKEK